MSQMSDLQKAIMYLSAVYAERKAYLIKVGLDPLQDMRLNALKQALEAIRLVYKADT